MRRVLLRAILMVVAIGAVALTATALGFMAKRDEPAAKTISGSGCVTAGVEAGCLVVTDTKTNVAYNVFFHGKKPRIGTAIRFSGTPHDGMTMCMQGQAVNVTKWFQLKMKCKPAN